MNKRIRELAEQAGWTEGYYESDDGPFIEPEFNKEKFAELIVRECADLFEVEYGQSEVSGNEVAKVVKKHFGVKE
jgi:hypothetical protein